MKRFVHSITVCLLFLLLPSFAFTGNMTVKDTVKGCSSCEHSQALLPECCRGTDARAMGDICGHQRPVEDSDCTHSGFCRQEGSDDAALTSSVLVDTVFPAGSTATPGDYGISSADISLDRFFLPPERLTSIYILHCAFLI